MDKQNIFTRGMNKYIQDIKSLSHSFLRRLHLTCCLPDAPPSVVDIYLLNLINFHSKLLPLIVSYIIGKRTKDAIQLWVFYA